MALVLNLYVLKDNGTLLTSLANASPVNPLTLPLFYGDTLTINCYVLTQIQSAINPANNFPYSIVNNAGLLPVLNLYNGTIAGASAPLASAIGFAADPTNSYVSGTLALGTPGLLALLGANTTAKCYLSFGFIQNGQPTTCLDVQVEIGIGVQNVVAPAPAGTTPLTLAEALLLFFPIQPVSGQPLYLASASGKVFSISVVDDGSGSHIDESPVGLTV